MKNNVILTLGIGLIAFSLFSPYLNTGILNKPAPAIENYVVDAPSREDLLQKAKAVTDIIKQSSDSTTRSDCLKLSSLYSDMATLIELDGEDKVISDTENIKEANSLSGKMLRLKIKDKYPGLAEASKELIVLAIGDDNVNLDDKLRKQSAEAFRALSWAFYEGSK